MFPCQRLLFSETKKKWEVKFCASNTETTATYSKPQHQGNSGCMFTIKYSKLTLVTRFRKREQREKEKPYHYASLEAIQIQTLLTVGCMKYQYLPEFSLFFSFTRPFAQVVTRGQPRSHFPMPRQPCLLRSLNSEEM